MVCVLCEQYLRGSSEVYKPRQLNLNGESIHFFGIMSIKFLPDRGKRNEHGIPLRKLFIFGRDGLPQVRDWIREWLK